MGGASIRGAYGTRRRGVWRDLCHCFHFALVEDLVSRRADDIVRSLDWLSIGLKLCVLRLMMERVRVSFLCVVICVVYSVFRR